MKSIYPSRFKAMDKKYCRSSKIHGFNTYSLPIDGGETTQVKSL